MSNLWTCNYCKKDYSNELEKNQIVQKIILNDYANMLCHQCRLKLTKQIKKIAIEFLS